MWRPNGVSETEWLATLLLMCILVWLLQDQVNMVLVIIWWFRNCLPRSDKILRKEITLTKRSEDWLISENTDLQWKMYIWLRIRNLSKPGITSHWALGWYQIKNQKVACLRASWIVSSYELQVMRSWSFTLEYFSLKCLTFRIRPPKPVGRNYCIFVLPLFWYSIVKKASLSPGWCG